MSHKKRRATPAHHSTKDRRVQLSLTLPGELIDRIDAWRDLQASRLSEPRMSRSDTIKFQLEWAFGPSGFGEEPLTAFFDMARSNQHATFDIKGHAVARLTKLDELFVRGFHDWRDPEDDHSPMLGMRSHAAFRAACGFAMSGQFAEVFPLLRTSLEYAGYALHLVKHPELTKVWLARHDSKEAMDAAKRAFRMSRIEDTLTAADKATAARFQQFYQGTIDFGAHPNERAVTGNTHLQELEGVGQIVGQFFLHGDGAQLDFGLRACTVAGACVLNILFIAFPTKFATIADELRALELSLSEEDTPPFGDLREES